MVEIEQVETFTARTGQMQERRSGSKGILARFKRVASLAVYVPVAFLARLVLNVTHTYGEARSISITQHEVAVSQLPTAFDGLTIAFLTDFHCSPETPPAFLEQVVNETNALKPDVILLGGDYTTEGRKFISPVGDVLARLKAPLGVYGVLGNHDFYGDVAAMRKALKRAGIVEMTNSGRWLNRNGSRLRIAGVGDLWEDVQDLDAALSGVEANETAILISHNPDYAMDIQDPRVGLVLSGHTHGGQINLPRVGTVATNSKYGRRLTSGRIALGSRVLYVSRGLGTVMIPFRYKCPPEVTLLTLRTIK